MDATMKQSGPLHKAGSLNPVRVLDVRVCVSCLIKRRGLIARVVVMCWPCPRQIHPLLLDMVLRASAANTLEVAWCDKEGSLQPGSEPRRLCMGRL